MKSLTDLIPMMDNNVVELFKIKYLPRKIFEERYGDMYGLLHKCKCGLIKVKHTDTNEEHYGITAAFGEGVSCYISNEDKWFTTSTIKNINWKTKEFTTVNSVYKFTFEELDLNEICTKILQLEQISKSEEMLKVKIKKLDDRAVIPTYAHPGVDMGMDVTAIDVKLDYKTQCFVYHTGLAFEVPEGYGMFIFPRSSNRKTEAYLANHVGILDSSYRGELMLMYKNRDADNHNAPYSIGDRVGQIVIMPYPQVEFEEVDELSETERGEGAFGSTGK